MKNRSLIAVISPAIEGPVAGIIRGIASEAAKYDMDTAVFSVFLETFNEDKNRKCEENIYSLINFDSLSGVIFLESEFWTERVKNRIFTLLLKKCRVPVIKTGTSGYGRMPSFHREGVYEAVSHLIEVHGCRNIMFLAGPEGETVSEERIKGYIRALKNHRLQASKKNVIYGDFWTEAADRLADKISGKKKSLPDAVACANDIMAASLVTSLTARGIRVPEDIKVTGFDGSENAYMCSPSVTTYYPPLYEYGASLFRRLYIQMNGNNVSDIKMTGHLLCSGSCGCFQDNTEALSDLKMSVLRINRRLQKFDLSDFSERCSSALNQDEVITAADCCSYLLEGYKHMYICLGRNEYTEEQYPDRMTIMLDKIEFDRTCKNMEFRTIRMLPELSAEREKPEVFWFFPVQFCGKSFGYAAFTMLNPEDVPDRSYMRFIRIISDAFYRVSVRTSCTESQPQENEQSGTKLMAPKWIYELMRDMRRPENFLAGIPRMNELSHVSHEHLSRMFRKYLDTTPASFINGLKLEYAASLITEKKYEIADACYAAGFSNLSHFYHLFKKKYGCSPKKYIEKNTGE